MTYPDRWKEAVDNNEQLVVYVPRQDVPWIAHGSGVVGRPRGGQLEVCFEGNLNGAENLRTFEERVQCAAGRLLTGYPTVARSICPFDLMLPVGLWTAREGLRLDSNSRLDEWLT